MNKLLYNSKDERYFYIGYDEGAMSPRKEMDHSSRFITWEGRSASPDKNPFPEFEDFLKNFDVPMTGNLSVDLDNLMDEMADRGNYVCLPVWKYDHSGVVYRAAEGNPFPDYGYDSMLAGIIYEEVLEHEDPERIKENLKAEVYEEYSAWIEGNIFTVNEYDKNGEFVDGISGIYNQDFDDEIFIDALNDYLGADINEMEDLWEVPYETYYEWDEELMEDVLVHPDIAQRIELYESDLEDPDFYIINDIADNEER